MKKVTARQKLRELRIKRRVQRRLARKKARWLSSPRSFCWNKKPRNYPGLFTSEA